MNVDLLPALLLGCALGYFAGAAAQRICQRSRELRFIKSAESFTRTAARVVKEMRG